MAAKLKKVFEPGETKTLSLRITNRADERQPIRFELEDVPLDWDVVLERDDLVLDGGADGLLRVSIRAPEVAEEKQKVDMRLLTVPELRPDDTAEIRILAKLKPGKAARGRDGEGDEAKAEAVAALEAGEAAGFDEVGEADLTVIRPGERRAAPEPEEVVEWRYAPALTGGGIYHVTHVPVGDGTLLKVKEQVQLLCALCSAQDVCFDGKLHRYMDWDRFIESDHCWLESGEYRGEARRR